MRCAYKWVHFFIINLMCIDPAPEFRLYREVKVKGIRNFEWSMNIRRLDY
jgi:hypothetical protein